MRKLLVVLLMLTLVAACAPATPQVVEKEVVVEKPVIQTVVVEKVVTATPAGPPKGGTLVYGLYAEPDSLDPHVTGQGHAHLVMRNVFETLIKKDANNEYQPCLASSWEISDDGLVYTFHLRKDVKFHDGTPFNAEAVKFNFDRILDPETKSRYAVLRLAALDRLELVDDYTVKIHLKEPVTPFLEFLSHNGLSMVSPTAAQQWGVEEFQDHLVGTGPFMFKEWIRKSVIRLVRNPDYNWGSPMFKHEGPAYLDGIEYRPIIEPATRVSCLEAGECQIIDQRDVPLEEVDRLSQREDIGNIVRPNSGLPRQWQLNMRLAPTDELAVRQAITFATDREEVSKKLYLGYMLPAYSFLVEMPPYTLEFKDELKYDPEKAKAILEEAGWIDADGDGIRERDGKDLQVILFSLPEDPLIELTQAQLRKVGIDVVPSVTIGANLRGVLIEGTQWHLFLFGWGAADPDVCMHDYYYGPLAGQRPNYEAYVNDKVDELLDEGRRTAVGPERVEIYHAIQRQLLEDLPTCPVYVRTSIRLINTSVKDVTPNSVFDELEHNDTYIGK